jgi:hypothetical protein
VARHSIERFETHSAEFSMHRPLHNFSPDGDGPTGAQNAETVGRETRTHRHVRSSSAPSLIDEPPTPSRRTDVPPDPGEQRVDVGIGVAHSEDGHADRAQLADHEFIQ